MRTGLWGAVSRRHLETAVGQLFRVKIGAFDQPSELRHFPALMALLADRAESAGPDIGSQMTATAHATVCNVGHSAPRMN
jgi:hypothetical protein